MIETDEEGNTLFVNSRQSMEKLWVRLKKWHEGTFVPYENDPDSSIVWVGGRMKRPRLAMTVDIIFNFWCRHWQWLIGVFAVPLLYRMFLK